jgi:hypothetical protein
MTETIRVPRPRVQRTGPGLHRIAATVEDREVFFESSLPLSPRPDSLVCAFLLPAMARGVDLSVEGGLGAGFLANLSKARMLAREWWPWLSRGEVRAVLREDAPATEDAGLFYTGGVDSTYALHELHRSLRYAVFIEGFDIPLEDTPRLTAARAWLSHTTRTSGVAFAVVRTNLRSHPLFRALNWEITHGAALASVAHALGAILGKMYLSASDVAPPWGSRPELDAAWSSASMRVESYGAQRTRLERVAAIAGWEPVRGRLRVCWENKSSDLNCGYCERCVRTRLQLHASGAPDALDSFPAGPSLRLAVRRLDPLQQELRGQWHELARALGDTPLRRDVERALARDRPPHWRRGARGAARLARRAARWASRRAAALLF